MSKPSPPPPSPRRALWWAYRAGVLLLAAGLAATGLWGYRSDQDSRELSLTLEGTTSPNRVDVFATILRIDPGAREALVRVHVVPEGTIADPDMPYAPARNLGLYTSSAAQTTLTFPAGQPATEQNIRVGLDSGWPTDYPQDHYALTLGFSAHDGTESVPIRLTVASNDSLFVLKAPQGDYVDATSILNLTAKRSRGGWLLAWFMMIVAWALALVVAGGSWILVSKRRGLVWPALGWMATTLFALISLRNAAPGSPPIGSLIDYMSFFWAEAIIAGSLVATALAGILSERPAHREDAAGA
jgi:Domain of unknown function (DUF4436)